MQDFNCDHHLVIGNEFATSQSDNSATLREIRNFKKRTKKTITLMEVDDLARLVSIVPKNRVGISRIRDLFLTCVTPKNCREWIDKLESAPPENPPFREILETIWLITQEQPNEQVEYAAVVNELRHRKPRITMSKLELVERCRALQALVPGLVFARENVVEIDRDPEQILEDVIAYIGEPPTKERSIIHI
jgi:hypothetical protein